MDPTDTALEAIRAMAVPTTYVVALTAIALETLVLALARKPRGRRSGRASLASGGLSFGLLFAAHNLLYAGLLVWAWHHRLATLGASWPVWLGTFVGYDLLFYVAHRVGHTVRVLWCFHSVHHTADVMRLTTAVRGSAFDFVYLPWFFVWIPLLGVHPALLLVVESFSRIWGVMVHVSPHLVGRLGVLDRLLVTPSVHRVHHGTEVHYLDANYGEVLLVWDRLFGTFQHEDVPPTYGLLRAAHPDALGAVHLGPWRALWHDLLRARTWSARLRYVFDAPGYSEDGPDERVRSLRRRLEGTLRQPS